MTKANTDIRAEIQAAGLKLWEVGYETGIAHDSNFSRLLRRELPPEKKEAIRDAIKRLVAREKRGNL